MTASTQRTENTPGAPRILSILARAGVEKYASAESQLAELFARQFPTSSRDVIVVDNLLPPGAHERTPHREVIGGDNAFWEFSAFDAAIRHVGERLFHYDWVHLATSAFGELYTAYLERFNERLLAAAAGRGVCLCHIDCYNTAIVVEGYPSQHWARTSFIMLPPSELATLGTLVSARSAVRFFSEDPVNPFRHDAPLSEQYRQYIVDWLTGGDIGQGVTWHSSATLTPATLPVFQNKALAILNEHLLSIRLRAQGCLVTDVTWLSAMLAAGGTIDWSTPWRAQLAGRDRDVILLRGA